MISNWISVCELFLFPFSSDNCPVDFIKKGCYNNLLNGRPLPQLLFTDLDESSPDFSGFAINWGNWDSHLDDMVCRCAQLSKAKGFGNFGIANFGEYRVQLQTVWLSFPKHAFLSTVVLKQSFRLNFYWNSHIQICILQQNANAVMFTCISSTPFQQLTTMGGGEGGGG